MLHSDEGPLEIAIVTGHAEAPEAQTKVAATDSSAAVLVVYVE